MSCCRASSLRRCTLDKPALEIREQFTGAPALTGALEAAGIRISMDGRGRWMDNVFIERVWRSLKTEEIYLKGYADGREAKAGIAEWFGFYNNLRPHQALAYRTPMAVWRDGVMGAPEAVDMPLLLRSSLDNADALPTYPATTAATGSVRFLMVRTAPVPT